MRPLWYEFGNEPDTFERDDAFMFGDAYYVQPIVNPGISKVNVSLPGGLTKTLWYEFRVGKPLVVFNGGKTYEIDGYHNSIPIFRKGGTITVEKHRLRRSSLLMKYDPLTLVITLDTNGNAFGYYYHDDEESLLFEQKQAYLLSHLAMNKCSLENKVLHTNNVQKIPYILIERIAIFGNFTDMEYFIVSQDDVKTTNTEFALGKNYLFIRKPPLTLDKSFTIQFMKKDGRCGI